MQNAFKHQENTLKSWMQHDKMKLHAKSSKFHIEHTQNGATVHTTREKPSSSAGFGPLSSVGTGATNKALQLMYSSSAY